MALTSKEFTERRFDWRIAVAAGVVIVIAVSIWMFGRDNTTPEHSASGPVAAGPEAPGKGSPLPQQPELVRSPADPAWLTGAPHDISWQRVDGVPLPFSSSDGPARIDGAVASGYSHTPQGAVMAAAQISFRLAWSPDYERVVRAQTAVSDQTRQQLVDARASNSLDPAVVGQYASAPVAFKIAEYTAEATTLWLAFPARDGQFTFARAALVWSGNDWKYSDQFSVMAIDLPPSPSLDGFTRIG